MNRRSFLSLIMVAVTFVFFRVVGLLKKKSPSAKVVDKSLRLDQSTQRVEVAPGSIIRLPNKPRRGQEISFVYPHEAANRAKIFSIAHPIGNEWGPLYLDEPAVFNLNFDEKKGEWYVINFGVFVPTRGPGELSLS